MKISFSSQVNFETGILCVPMYEGKQYSSSAQEVEGTAPGVVSRALKDARFEGKKGEVLVVYGPEGLKASRLVLFGLGDPKELKEKDGSDIGAKIYKALSDTFNTNAVIYLKNLEGSSIQLSAFIKELGLGLLLRTYRFDHYKTKLTEKDKNVLEQITLCTEVADEVRASFHHEEALAKGIFLTRNLMWEPANVLYPETMSKRVKELESLGVQVKVLGEKEMEALGMGALLCVGQGSGKESKLIVLEWHGADKTEAPIAFVGKGVTFDTGGISIKPASKMDEMKMDMGGAAVVAGLFKTLALRKAKANVVGVLGMVENMPDGNSVRPGDIVKSMSGQTIEVLNTDAEGRLVLADALWYTQEMYQPCALIDLATLTGAMLVALGAEYAGIFSNHDGLAEKLKTVSQETDEKVWRLPLDEAYNRMMDSDIADMKNISGTGHAGSITAAQFLQRFIQERTPWVHMDIAGVAWSGKEHPLSGKFPSGYGVRILDRLISTYYESK
jgi:leucyl aminopeptidase